MRTFLVGIIAICFTLPVLAQTTQRFQAVPFTTVVFDDAFWSPRLQTCKEISIPHNFKWCEETGRFDNFAKAAGLMEGDFRGIYYDDSDVYKLLEGTAYFLADPDPELERAADKIIDWIAAAQQPNGYINTYYQLREPDNKWTNTRVMHELYCIGHLIEAAIAYRQATGKTKLLEVAEKAVVHIAEVFGYEEGKRREVPGHQGIELALVKLYELTGEQKYFDLAKMFIDLRGNQARRTDRLQGEYSQDHKPVRQQDDVVGHAVRAMYLYCGMSDVAARTGDRDLMTALDKLWFRVVNKKMYITGGIGARHSGEAFGEDYELPNRSAYCETCAAIGLTFWAHRMNLLHGSAMYADVVERAIYNGVLAGIGMDGKSFFYVNPLDSAGNHQRQPFFSTACCPTNVVRFVPSLPGYQYTRTKLQADSRTEFLIVNQYIAGTAVIPLEHCTVQVTMETDYPNSGKIRISLTGLGEDTTPVGSSYPSVVIRFRIPEWTNGVYDATLDNRQISFGGLVPGTLQRTIPIGSGRPGTPRTGGYNHSEMIFPTMRNRRGETTTSTLEIEFPMTPKRMISHPNVVTNRGRVAIQRGPLVYCFEQVDNVVPIAQIRLARNPEFKEEFKPDLLGGITVLTCKNTDGRTLTAIPYYAWGHREPGAMAVWVRQEGLSRDQPPSTNDALYTTLRPDMLRSDAELADEYVPEVTASHCFRNDSVEAVVDGLEPANSNDHSIPRMTFWDHRGTAEWLELDFGRVLKVSQSSVYWFDDTGRGQCRVPQSWTLSYRSGDHWIRVETTGTFDIGKDRYNTVEFEAVETTGLRLDIQLQEGVSGGVLAWKYE